MAGGKERLGFELDTAGMQKQLDDIVKKLVSIKTKAEGAGKTGTKAFSDLEKVIKNTQNTVARLTAKIEATLRKVAVASTGALKKATTQIQLSETKIQDLKASTNLKIQKLEDSKVRMAERSAKRVASVEAKNSRLVEVKLARERKLINQLGKLREKAQNDQIKMQSRLDNERQKAFEKRRAAEQRLTKTIQQETEKRKAALSAVKAAIYLRTAKAIKDVIKVSTILAAQNEVLGTAMRVVGVNMGFTVGELENAELTMRRLGISIKDSRTTIQRFAQANLTMADAVNVSRAAQDLAAGSTKGSSEALEIMTNAILSLLPRQLRQFGIVVDLNNVYRDYAATLGRTVPSLSRLDKRQSVLNVIMLEAEKRAGAYERSMQDVGKILTSLSSRIIPDTLSMFGDFLLPIFSSLVKNFQAMLEGLQGISGGWKALGVVVTVVLGTVLAIKGAMLAGAVALNIFGQSASAAAVGSSALSVSLGPVALAITGLVAAITIASVAWRLLKDSETEEFNQAKKNVAAANERIAAVEKVEKVVKNETAIEAELVKVLRDSARKNKELLPFLTQEKIDREALIETLNNQKQALSETAKIAEDVAKKQSQLLIAARMREKEAIDSVIASSELLAKARKDGTEDVAESSEEFKKFQRRAKTLTDSLGAAAKARVFSLGLQGSLGDIDAISNRSLELGKQIDELVKSHRKGFGVIGTDARKSIEDITLAVVRVNKEIEKIGKKTVKKHPFELLNKLYQDNLNAIEATGAKAKEKLELRNKLEEVILAERTRMNLKYNVDAAKLGASRVRIAELNAAREIEKVKGGKEAEIAIAKKFMVEVNKIAGETWENNIKRAQEATDILKGVYANQRDVLLGEINQRMERELTSERFTELEKVRIRKNFTDEAVVIENEFNQKVLAAEDGVLQMREERLKALLAGGVISEEIYSEKVKALASERRQFLQQQTQERIDFLKQSIDSAISEESRLNASLLQLADERLGILRSGEDIERQLRQRTQTEEENYREDRRVAEDKMFEAREALENNNFDLAKKLAKESIGISQSLAKEVSEGAGEEKKVVVDKNAAVEESIQKVKEANEILLDVNAKIKDDTIDAITKIRNNIEEWRSDLSDLTTDPHEVSVELAGDALEGITTIKDELQKLTAEPHVVTIIVKRLQSASTGETVEGGDGVDGGGEGGGSVGDGGGEGLANGAIDLRGRNKIGLNGKGTETSDSILASLSKGESVISAATTRMFKPLLNMMQSQPLMLKNLLKSVPSRAPSTGGAATFGDININVTGVKDAEELQSLNWKRIVRDQIAGELTTISKRRNKQRL